MSTEKYHKLIITTRVEVASVRFERLTTFINTVALAR
jgi:hypothetical protein